jgi:hypothetical protein
MFTVVMVIKSRLAGLGPVAIEFCGVCRGRLGAVSPKLAKVLASVGG